MIQSTNCDYYWEKNLKQNLNISVILNASGVSTKVGT